MKIVDYKNYGKCALFERNGVQVMVTLDVGPRIIRFGTAELNFLNEDLDRNVSNGGDYFDENFGKGTRWYLYGGHRVWKSPEDWETYTPDNGPVEYEASEYGGSFVCRAAKRFDYTLEVLLDEKGGLTVKNKIGNKSSAPAELAVWGLTVAAKGGTLVLPLNEPADELNPVQNVVYWPYDDLVDERLKVGKKYLTLKQTSRENAIKVGTFAKKGRAYYILGGKAMKWECLPEKGVYGDFWCNFESYTNNHILEVEWLSPLKELPAGGEVSMTEKWSVVDAEGFDGSAKSLEKFK